MGGPYRGAGHPVGAVPRISDEMTRTRQLTLAFALGRVGFGAGLLGPPGALAERWLGPDAARPATGVAVRGLAARDIALALGAADSVRRGASPRAWLVAAAACDVVDVVATLAGGDALPSRARAGTVALAGLSALAGAALAMRSDG